MRALLVKVDMLSTWMQVTCGGQVGESSVLTTAWEQNMTSWLLRPLIAKPSTAPLI